MHVAVLGAGLMGTATALFLARRGASVTMYDAADAPLTGASRWNEGKIHLGFLYAADASLRTAHRLLPGGLAFKPLIEHLIGGSIEAAITPGEDIYLVHRDSVATAAETLAYFRSVEDLCADHPWRHRYLRPLAGRAVRPLSRAELEADYDTGAIVSGVRVPERSVSTVWIADRLVEALDAERRIERRVGTQVESVCGATAGLDGPLSVRIAGEPGPDGPFDAVINCLWQGRPAVDRRVGLPMPATLSHRYRLSVFLRTAVDVAAPNAVVATGPFGDIKNYNGRDFYLSWYLTGLVAEGNDVAPPPVPRFSADDRRQLGTDIIARIGAIVKPVAAIAAAAEHARVEGGWVCAVGEGSLADRASTLHRRDRIGVTRQGAYVSIDTGKYSMAPWLALQVVDSLCSDRPARIRT